MKITHLLGIGAAAFVVAACTTNPMTGRKSLQIGTLNSEITSTAVQQYQQTLKESKVVTGAQAQMVKKVGNNIKLAAERYYASIGRAADLSGYQWEFNLLQDKQVNAWCMPGGKVAVYTGILPITKDETGLAVVMGHEVSHALAGHGNERISQAMVAQYGGALLGGAISNQQIANVVAEAYPAVSQVALLKYGRTQESEADEMGLNLMAIAGYDPRQAIPFWQRMEASSSGARQPEFLSTHPSPATRVADIQKDLPKALEYYKTAGGKI
ncbi:TPR repeat-containing protein YfgC precursor [Chryseobacterium sp. MOF25P]|uniref:M48 family metallopeptidase n=1 Tax=unclassified Chryseobacterium TaxID=2593645 RepID=UPI0008055AFF|nr:MULTISPECIES: M48 family metallopeptidase [unclassified Chryseobacterium]OBW43195.1 TPR repeat-containing protein YfgC precursor [Chryseobacterium sp. MOF25P]OBW46348.1 TPR repeat-containing protein YfgC precursor [Chryseobacterium sp. BGARF1]